MISQDKKQWRFIVQLVCLLLLMRVLASCELPGLDTSDQQTSKPAPTRIVASYTPARILQFCADTYPLVPDSLFTSAAGLVVAMLDSPSSMNVNEGKIQVYISYIVGSNSYLKDAFAWSLDAIPADPPMPVLTPTPNPATSGNSYEYANAVSTVQAGNEGILRTWYAQLNANHAFLAAARATMKQYAARLRSLANINSPSPEEVGGCLLSASNRMAGFVGRKTIILSSPLAEDASALPFIDLSGIAIEVINWNCVLSSASACITSRKAWEGRLLSFHASSVSIRDVQQSQVVKPTF